MEHRTTRRADSNLTNRSELAGDAVRRIMQLASTIRHHQDLDIARLGLTPAVARALHELDPDQPLPARELAEQLRCDRSNVTALVDRLEQAGLVERRVDPADRRQKTLVVTEAGRRMRAQVHRLTSDPRLLADLSDDELVNLTALVSKASDNGCPETSEAE
ncbi:MarR family winged helix-turn-helix transcriptional regulator [Salinispora arenicola]|uniref:MarR family transcriptional regulator n=2 Tax=Salinispora arenicola TaxID=168697 RepID=A0A542XP29_SALAC|nr:MarR family transcriptional regulator [Salinispora arenicola]MCN0154432.1 MarR family transcriptional regulator [Salinispora arenicola]MCN0178868.1 MarR family transcriptional regulator [Salinispora arenicola]NIL43304.1 MarR family transcriptional regulator [Salinispora arenicola]NIL59276.1 MarR family transcriptional regulator [Salinispora arenicola]NIL60159.1 MarR family transcriptional regulator [Salinispora arenicola]